MFLPERLTQFRLESVIGLLSLKAFGGEGIIIKIRAFAIDDTKRSERNVDLAILSVGLEDAHNLICHVTSIDKMSKRLRVAEENGLGRLINDDNLAAITDIYIIDIATLDHLDAGYFSLIGEVAIKIHTYVFRTITDCATALSDIGANLIDIVREMRLGQIEIAIVKAYIPAILQALEGFTGPAGKDLDTIESPLGAALLKSMDYTISGSEKDYKDKNAPRHGKPRERRTQLIAPDGGDNLANEIKHGQSSTRAISYTRFDQMAKRRD